MSRIGFSVDAAACAGGLVSLSVLLFGCLDADPLGVDRRVASLDLRLSYVTGPGPSKVAEVDSVRIALYDVTDNRWTDAPQEFPLAAEVSSLPGIDDATGRHFLARLSVDLSGRRIYRIRAFLSQTDGGGRQFSGERTVTLEPGASETVSMVMTSPPGIPDEGTYGLAVAKSVAIEGERHEIPIVLSNGAPLGGIQFRLRFDRAVVDSVKGIHVDPASRLYVGSGGDPPALIETHLAMPTDSTLQVVAIDLKIESNADGDSLSAPLHPLAPGNDLLFFVVVDLRDNLPDLPDTMDLTLDEVFFSTPSGSSDVAVEDPKEGILIITE